MCFLRKTKYVETAQDNKSDIDSTLAHDPVYIIGFLFMKACEFTAGRAGLMICEVEK